jgi:large subunit ribosomal protein L7A
MGLDQLLNNKNIRIGVKQTSRAISEDMAVKVFVAEDADAYVTRRIIQLSNEKDVPVEYIPTMKELGKACKIDVGAATAVIIK